MVTRITVTKYLVETPYSIGYNWSGKRLKREFVRTAEFDKQWKQLGLTEEDAMQLEIHLCMNPKRGDVIVGTGGLRKLRWSLPHRGKRGSIRVLYVDFIFCEKLYLITAYPKNKKDNLTDAERAEIKKFVEVLESVLKRK